MERWDVLNGLFDKKKIAILQMFFHEPQRKWYLAELAKESKLPMATAMRILRSLVKLEIIHCEAIGRIKLYTAAPSESFSYLMTFLQQERQILAEFVKQLVGLEGIESVVLHGKPLKNRANLLIIGKIDNPQAVRDLCSDFLEKHNFTVSSLTLTREQFDQMTAMGLYSGEKRILFSRGL